MVCEIESEERETQYAETPRLTLIQAYKFAICQFQFQFQFQLPGTIDEEAIAIATA